MFVSFFEDEEEPFEEEEVTQTRRPRHGRRRRPPAQSPLVRVLIILVAVVVLVLVVSLGIKGCLNNRTIGEYRDYFNSVSQTVNDSNNIGKQLSDMLQRPSVQVRGQLEQKLTSFQKSQDKILEEARAIQAPDKFQSENEWFVASMQIRNRGLNGLLPALMNALQATDDQAGAAQVSDEMLILLTSDVAYDEFFSQPCQQVLKDEDITDIKVPQAKFLQDPAMASQQNVVAMIEGLKGGTAQVPNGLHGVALTSVKLMPSGQVLNTDGVNTMKAGNNLTFEVEVENQGDFTETDVSASLNLTSPGQPVPQKVDGKIPSIAPGERKTIDLSGLAAKTGSQFLLKVDVGPVPGEHNTSNNSGEYNITFN